MVCKADLVYSMSKVLSAGFLGESPEKVKTVASLVRLSAFRVMILFTPSNFIGISSQAAGPSASLRAGACRSCADTCGTPMEKDLAGVGSSAQTHPHAGDGGTLDDHKRDRASQKPQWPEGRPNVKRSKGRIP